MDWKRKYVTSRILYISYENHGMTSHISALRLLHKISLCTYGNEAFQRRSYFASRFITWHIVSEVSALTSSVAKGVLVGHVFERFHTKLEKHGQYALLHQ